jgi:hypothetical protein
VHALNGAGWGAPFLGFVFPLEVFHRVILERDAGIAALLRTPVDLAFLADVQIARARAATPFVRFAFSDAVLEPIQTGVVFVAVFYGMEDLLSFRSGLTPSPS